MVDKVEFRSPIRSTSAGSFSNVWSKFPMHFIHLLTVLLLRNGFACIKKTVMDETGRRPPNSQHDLLFGATLAS